MADVLRSCAKTGCRWPAAASLSYRYATRQVWLLDLASTPDPSLYDLCPHHADYLVVPQGWERVDDRSAVEVMVEPSAFDRAEEAARRRMTAVEPPPRHASQARSTHLVGAVAGRNRYAALAEQLPKLAAEQAQQADDGADRAAQADHGPGAVPAAQPPPRPDPPTTDRRPAEPGTAPAPPGPLADRGRTGPTTGAGRPPLPVRELAPRTADDMTPPPPAASPDPAPPEPDAPLPGQLSIPVEELGDDTSGVVLQFDFAGARRRGKSS